MKEQTNIQIFYLFIYLSEAKSYYVTLACLDLTVQIRLAYNSEIYLSLSPDLRISYIFCIEDVQHHT